MTDFDPTAFGLPADANSGPGFMYNDGADIAVDENDPIYKQVKAAMDADAAARGVAPTPAPAEQPRPPELIANKGENNDPETPPVTPPADLPPAATAPLDGADDGTTPPAETAPATDTFALKIDGQDYTLNTEQAEYLLRVNSWLEAVPPEMKQAWSAIEQGTAVAISVEELTRLRAAAAATQQPARQPAAPAPPNVDDLDDDVVAYIQSLEARVAPTQQQQPTADAFQQQGQPSAADIAAAANHQAQRAMQMRQELDQVNTAWQAQWGLTDQQMERLGEVTAQLNVIPRLSNQQAQYSPTGQLLREASFPAVIRDAYEMAMNADPDLRAVRDEMIYTQRVAQEAHRNSAVNTKKSLAGSLASTPSAAVPATGAAPKIGPDNRMDLQATSNAIATALAEMQQQS